MSFLATEWALGYSPTADPYETLILVALANHADDLGCGAYPGQATLARSARCDERTVRRRLASLEKRGVIARGDQRLVRHISPDRRPVVWDIQIPRSWYSDAQWEQANQRRIERGRPPIDPASRPDLPEIEPPRRATRSDKGTSRPRKRATSVDTPDVPPAVAPGAGGLVVRQTRQVNP